MYNVAIIGGGLAGLTLAIQCAKAGYTTILFEKETYPFHKVCGEYISLESKLFLNELGFDIENNKLPIITKLQVTAPNGNKIEQQLDLGGFGVSRYLLDNELYKIAKKIGVNICESVKVEDVNYEENFFTITTTKGVFKATITAGCFGKRSNLDVKLKRTFNLNKTKKLENFIGVKYHVNTNFPDDLIALHNFKDGYCGISKIENGKCCVCYLTTAKNLKENNNSISLLEQNVLAVNPHLKSIFSNSKKLFTQPEVIAQINFNKKKQIENHVLMIGDAAGMITPLCGNGMSMAMHGSKLAFNAMQQFLNNSINREAMEKHYQQNWEKQFSKRLSAGRLIQKLFGKLWLTNLFISFMKPFPKIIQFLVKQTHGNSF